jgi:hypothetical protein
LRVGHARETIGAQAQRKKAPAARDRPAKHLQNLKESDDARRHAVRFIREDAPHERVRLPLVPCRWHAAATKAATDPGEPGCAKPMRRVSASDYDELLSSRKKYVPLHWVWRVKVFGQQYLLHAAD